MDRLRQHHRAQPSATVNLTELLRTKNTINVYCWKSILWFADLAKIKDSAYPRALASASSAGRLGKYTSVDLGMSSHGDSSIGSDSEDEPIERVHCASNGEPKGDSPPRPSPFYSTGALPKKPDSGEPRGMQRTGDHAEFHSTREKRQVGNPYGIIICTWNFLRDEQFPRIDSTYRSNEKS